MKTLWSESKNLIGQLRGSQNIFGYRSTVANQLYLFYCFGGKMFFSNRVSKTVKYFWFFLILFQTCASYGAISAYLWYESSKDIMMIMNVANVFVVSTVAALGFPLISYLYGDDIEAMIQHVDEALTTKSNSRAKHKRVIANAKIVFITIMGPFVVCNLVYISICFFDLALFFEEEKVQNYLFYMLPIPAIRRCTSYRSYFIVNGVSTAVFEIFIVQLWSVLAVILYWITVCCNELICVRDDLDAGSRTLNVYVGTAARMSATWCRAFECIIRRAVKRFQNILNLIDYLRGFIQTVGTFSIPVTFFYGIAVLHICLSADILFILKLKFLSGYLATAFAAFQFYWVGEFLDDSVMKISTAVYSTPWYGSYKVRKNVYILLCQTQTVNDLTFIKVYHLLLKNFSRYLHGVFSYTNFLRRVTNNKAIV